MGLVEVEKAEDEAVAVHLVIVDVVEDSAVTAEEVMAVAEGDFTVVYRTFPCQTQSVTRNLCIKS